MTFVEAQAADLPENPDAKVPEHVFHFFVTKVSQLCKNALAGLDILYKANLARRKKEKEWKKLQMRKGTAAALDQSSINLSMWSDKHVMRRGNAELVDRGRGWGGGSTSYEICDVNELRSCLGGGWAATSYVPTERSSHDGYTHHLLSLSDDEFRNDALNQLEIVAKQEYYHVIWQQFEQDYLMRETQRRQQVGSRERFKPQVGGYGYHFIWQQ